MAKGGGATGMAPIKLVEFNPSSPPVFENLKSHGTPVTTIAIDIAIAVVPTVVTTTANQ